MIFVYFFVTVSESFKNVQPGDCIVCFSKNDIYHVSRQLEKVGVQVAVIYGTLPASKSSYCVNMSDYLLFSNGHRTSPASKRTVADSYVQFSSCLSL